jgi:aryl-phospho-beta-D-glucosidase BglC (GH1 family)
MKTLLASGAALALLAAPAFATSGSYVVGVSTASNNYPHCVMFTMFDDQATTTYTISEQDPNYEATLFNINMSKFASVPLTFNTGASLTNFHPADCPQGTINGITYIYPTKIGL